MADAAPVGTAVGNATGGSGSTRTTPAKATTTGNFLFVAITHYTSGVNINSVTDTAGNSYAKAGTTQGGDSNHDNEIWFTANPITGHASNVVSVVFSGTPSFVDLSQSEFSWSGAASIAYDAEAAHALDAGPVYTSGSLTTTAADDLIIGNFVAYDVPSAITDDTGTILWQQGAGSAADDMVTAYRNTNAAGAYTIQLDITSGDTDRYSIVAKAFKAVAGASASSFLPPISQRHIMNLIAGGL